MKLKTAMTAAVLAVCSGAGHADDSAIVLGKSIYGSLCAVCHGPDAKGGGQVGELFEIKPPDLTTLAAQNDGQFPFSDAYEVVILGMEAPGHGSSEMPIWGDYFMADALTDRGVNKSDAMTIAAGRALSVVYYLESIQE
jgi:mono/diheme cytochrome c family protein